MDDSNLILTLLAVDAFAGYLCNVPHNSNYYRPPSYDFSRETTPSSAGERDLVSGEQETQYLGPRLELTFDMEPKNPERGFTFGSDRKRCDVWLRKKGISGIHFSVTFDKEGQLLLRDTSRLGTWVSLNGQRSSRARDHFTLVLGPDTSLKIDFGDDHMPQFAIKVPKHKSFNASFQAKRGLYMERSEKVDAALGLLDLSSQATTAQPSRAMSPRRRPWYFKESVIGKGGFGVVFRAREISSGHTYALKEFLEIDEDLGLRDRMRGEIDIMKSLPAHANIVQFVDSADDDTPSLVMEYLSRGNLIQEEKRACLTMEECVLLLCQGLEALRHIHKQGYVHRDITPANILVKSRDPFHIKLGDFGLTRSVENRVTFCGTPPYIAPEIWKNNPEKYTHFVPITTAVDIWALGVVVLQMAYQESAGGTKINEGCIKQIVNLVNDLETDPLSELLATKMLVTDPQRRLSAEACLQEASSIPREALQMRISVHPGPIIKDREALPQLFGEVWGKVTAESDKDSIDAGESAVTIKIPNRSVHEAPQSARSSSFAVKRRRVMGDSTTVGLRPKNHCSDAVSEKAPYIRMIIHGKSVWMRRSDAAVNARQLLSLTDRNGSQQRGILDDSKGASSVEVNRSTTEEILWMPLEHVETLSRANPLDDALKSCLNYGRGYISVTVGTHTVMIHRAGLYVNVTQIYRAAGNPCYTTKGSKVKLTVNQGLLEYQGTYYSAEDALQLCQSQGVQALGELLRETLEDHGYSQAHTNLRKRSSRTTREPSRMRGSSR